MLVCLWYVFGLREEIVRRTDFLASARGQQHYMKCRITHGARYGLSSRLSLYRLPLKRLLGWRRVFWEEGEDLKLL